MAKRYTTEYLWEYEEPITKFEKVVVLYNEYVETRNFWIIQYLKQCRERGMSECEMQKYAQQLLKDTGGKIGDYDE